MRSQGLSSAETHSRPKAPPLRRPLRLLFPLLALLAGHAGLAAAAATPLTFNAAPATASISAPGEIKYFSYALPMMIGDVTIEVIPGSLTKLEMAGVPQASGWNPVSFHVTSAASTYSLHTWFHVDNTPGKPQSNAAPSLGAPLMSSAGCIAVRALDGKSVGSFTIRVFQGPVISSFSINGGAVSTSNRAVTLNHAVYSGAPREYMACETPDFRGAAWRALSASIPFTLSATPGGHTVYFKVRYDANSPASAIVADSIVLNTPLMLTPGGAAQSASVSTPGEVLDAAFTVTQSGLYRLETKTLSNGPAQAELYSPSGLIAQDSPKVGALNVRVLKADLPAGKYSVRIRADKVPCQFQVSLAFEGAGDYFTINSFSAETSSRIVFLNSRISGAPTHYQASIYPDFRAAAWLPYAPAPKFKLNAGNTKKKVYFRVKYPTGVISPVQTTEITLREIMGIPLSTLWFPGNISFPGESDWYQFTVATEGRYTIETSCRTLEDVVMTLYGPYSQSQVIARDDDSTSFYAAKITASLKPGPYYVRVDARFPTETGSYFIQINKAAQ